MKSYFFPLFITILGLFTVYIFYALWHTEELNPPKIVEKQQEKTVEDLSDKAIVPKIDHPHSSIAMKNTAHTSVQSVKEPEMQKDEEMDKETDVPNLTPQQMQTQTEAVYDALTPENYEETMEEAAVAFEQLDTMVEEQDAKLAEEMQAVEEAQEASANEPMDDETPVEESSQEEQTEMSVPENEEEVDMENEDANSNH